MSWLLRRILTSLVLAWVVVTIVFLALHIIPGDPAELLLTADNGIAPSPAAVNELRRNLGLDRPIAEQYATYIFGLLRGDLGNSLLDGYPVADEIALRLPRTIELVFCAAAIAMLIGMPLGVFSAVRHGSSFDRSLTGVMAIFQATPVSVIGTLLVLVFAQTLKWMPAGGYVAFSVDPLRHLALLALPALATSIRLLVEVFRMMRASVLDVLARDFVRTARAKGVPRARALSHHVARAALIPVVTVIGLDMGAMLGGTVLVEYVFNWPGLSAPLMRSISARDYPMVSGIVLTISLLFLMMNLVTDLIYAWIDPRVRA